MVSFSPKTQSISPHCKLHFARRAKRPFGKNLSPRILKTSPNRLANPATFSIDLAKACTTPQDGSLRSLCFSAEFSSSQPAFSEVVPLAIQALQRRQRPLLARLRKVPQQAPLPRLRKLLRPRLRKPLLRLRRKLLLPRLRKPLLPRLRKLLLLRLRKLLRPRLRKLLRPRLRKLLRPRLRKLLRPRLRKPLRPRLRKPPQPRLRKLHLPRLRKLLLRRLRKPLLPRPPRLPLLLPHKALLFASRAAFRRIGSGHGDCAP